MTYGVYSFRDQKASFGTVWIDVNDEVAKRGFSSMMSNPSNIMGFAPGDFDLFKVGSFDADTGQITPVWPVEYLVNGRAVYMEGDKIEK